MAESYLRNPTQRKKKRRAASGGRRAEKNVMSKVKRKCFEIKAKDLPAHDAAPFLSKLFLVTDIVVFVSVFLA